MLLTGIIAFAKILFHVIAPKTAERQPYLFDKTLKHSFCEKESRGKKPNGKKGHRFTKNKMASLKNCFFLS